MLFGVSRSSGCFRKYTKDELRAECQSQATERKTPGEIIIDSSTAFGIYGNADFYNTGEWTSVNFDYPAEPAKVEWNQTTNACSGLINNVRIEFVTALTGAVQNPQAKILYARVQYLSTTWVASAASAATGAKQKYPIMLSVQFKQLRFEDTTEYTPPMPSVFPSLSDDIFYPFSLWNAATPFGAVPLMQMITTLALAGSLAFSLSL